ncbi:MAG: glycosyltransferase family 4 protein [Sedimentisphaerales bacterium]|nr:glycosyltransferase family 4 protein [Sedimentisphaerales bacterium]
MKAFMLGWEFPPFISGGLGTACYGLTKAMGRLGIRIAFVLPKAHMDDSSGPIRVLGAEGYIKDEEVSAFGHVKFHEISSSLHPYVSYPSEDEKVHGRGPFRKGNRFYTRSWHSEGPEQVENYPQDMGQQVHRYTLKVMEIATIEDFDIIHAHDWMTYPAGVAIAEATGKPLVVHVHSTECDRSGDNLNQIVYDIERRGMHVANKVIAVSNYTKNIIVRRYGVDPEKVKVVYNGVEHDASDQSAFSFDRPDKVDKIVLFLGRITMQKGPEYFLMAAKKVLEKIENVKFVMAGDGDMTNRMVEFAAYLGIGHKVLFTRFLKGIDVDRAYQMADLYVMPSVSEPFGIAPLEALKFKVPVIVSKQSGIAEVLTHALKVDFWDVHQMANKIVAVLKYPTLSRMLQELGHSEMHKFRWEDAAEKVKGIYEEVLAEQTVSR